MDATPITRANIMKIRGQRVVPNKERIQRQIEINQTTRCWEWQGAKKGKYMRYGHMTVGSRTDKTRRTMSAHRYSYEAFVGKIPSGLWVLHKCDNPSCVNPKHLFLGDRQANVDDRESKNRNDTSNIGKKAEQHPQAKLTWDDVAYIRNANTKRGDIGRLAKQFNVNHKTVSDVCLFKTWIPLPPQEQSK